MGSIGEQKAVRRREEAHELRDAVVNGDLVAAAHGHHVLRRESARVVRRVLEEQVVAALAVRYGQPSQLPREFAERSLFRRLPSSSMHEHGLSYCTSNLT